MKHFKPAIFHSRRMIIGQRSLSLHVIREQLINFKKNIKWRYLHGGNCLDSNINCLGPHQIKGGHISYSQAVTHQFKGIASCKMARIRSRGPTSGQGGVHQVKGSKIW